MKFLISLTEKQEIALHDWYQNVAIPAALKKHNVQNVSELYTGAIGGSLTYMFTPTSIGTIVIVKDSLSGLEVDLTEWENW